MSSKPFTFYNKCPDCGCDRTLTAYNFIDTVERLVGKGVQCISCMSRWHTPESLQKAQRDANQIKPHLVLVT